MAGSSSVQDSKTSKSKRERAIYLVCHSGTLTFTQDGKPKIDDLSSTVWDFDTQNEVVHAATDAEISKAYAGEATNQPSNASIQWTRDAIRQHLDAVTKRLRDKDTRFVVTAKVSRKDFDKFKQQGQVGRRDWDRIKGVRGKPIFTQVTQEGRDSWNFEITEISPPRQAPR